jgi:hypothetical protein
MSTLRILRGGLAALLVLLAILAIQDADALRKGRQDSGTPFTRAQAPAAMALPPATERDQGSSSVLPQPRLRADKLV